MTVLPIGKESIEHHFGAVKSNWREFYTEYSLSFLTSSDGVPDHRHFVDGVRTAGWKVMLQGIAGHRTFVAALTKTHWQTTRSVAGLIFLRWVSFLLVPGSIAVAYFWGKGPGLLTLWMGAIAPWPLRKACIRHLTKEVIRKPDFFRFAVECGLFTVVDSKDELFESQVSGCCSVIGIAALSMMIVAPQSAALFAVLIVIELIPHWLGMGSSEPLVLQLRWNEPQSRIRLGKDTSTLSGSVPQTSSEKHSSEKPSEAEPPKPSLARDHPMGDHWLAQDYSAVIRESVKELRKGVRVAIASGVKEALSSWRSSYFSTRFLVALISITVILLLFLDPAVLWMILLAIVGYLSAA